MLMADALGSPALALDPRFMSNDLRCSNRPAMVMAIEAITTREPVENWIAKLNEAGVPCSPINTIDKLFDHPQLKARNMIVKVRGQGLRHVRTAGNPIHLSGYADNDVETPAISPGLNQHREAILNELMATHGAYSNAAPDDVMPTDIMPPTHCRERPNDTGNSETKEAAYEQYGRNNPQRQPVPFRTARGNGSE
jgi:CoA:oxalate CoA-transferase